MLPPRDEAPLDETIANGGDAEDPSRRDPDSSATFRVGDLLADRYRIESFLARGGMGEVYRAEDLALGVPVALKTVRSGIASDPAALRQFKQEILLARCVSHPNVCRIYDLGRHQDATRDVSFFTMEYLPGETLRSRIDRDGPLASIAALPVVRQLCDALDAAHNAQVVHRDFKSANVMLTATESGGERAVITDFGLAVRTRTWKGGVDDTFDALVGTPAYMSPEQVRGEALGPASDLYSLGVVLYEMSTGRRPFEGDNPIALALERLSARPPSPSDFAPVSPDWEEAILKLLSLAPGDRFSNAGEVVRTLEGGPDLAPASSPRRSLPPEYDAFVGRQELLSILERTLEGSATVVSLLGVGGAGKTRLARRYGWESLERWPGGVWFCDLSEARDVNGIASAVSAALDVPLVQRDPILQLGHAISGRGRALVILDNCEQVTEQAAAVLLQWRARAREASFLVTTRERLHLEGESILEVDALDPESDGADLFEERARAQRPGFSVTPENRTMVVEIVRLLDGLPLAIELATSRLRMLSLEQLRGRLGDRLSVLSGSRRGRHSTLRATLDWSWSLLTVWERSAVAQASVFQGGFTLEAAESVIDLSVHADAPIVLDVIQSLVDKSWLRAQVVLQAPRFTMYATVQEYATEKLNSAQSGTAELRSAVTRRDDYFAAMGAADAVSYSERRSADARRAALRVELDNLIAVCRASLARGAAAIAAQSYLAAALALELQGRSELIVDLGREVLRQSLDAPLRGRVLLMLGWAESAAGKVGDARENYEAALTIFRHEKDRRSEGFVIGNLAALDRAQGRIEEARTNYETALGLHRECGNRVGEGMALGSLGGLQFEAGRMEDARLQFETALAIHREVGSRRFEGGVLGNLGVLHLAQGRTEEASRHFNAAIEIHREMGNRRSEGFVLGYLGSLELEHGRMEGAQAAFEAALSIHREVGNRATEGSVLDALGGLHHEQGRREAARSCHEAALAIHREVRDRRSEGSAIVELGELDLEQGKWEEARSHFDAALVLFREVGHRIGEAALLGSIGLLDLEQGKLSEANGRFEDGARILREIGVPLELAKLLCKLGEFERRQGKTDAARAVLAEVEKIAGEIGSSADSPIGREIVRLRERLDGPGARS